MAENKFNETLKAAIEDFIKNKKYKVKPARRRIRIRRSEQLLKPTYHLRCLFCGEKLPEYGVYGPRRRRHRDFCNVICKRHYRGMNYNSGVGWKEINEKRPKVCVICGSHDYAVLGLCKKCYVKNEKYIRKRRKETDKTYRKNKEAKQATVIRSWL